jgi:hypothetical protein
MNPPLSKIYAIQVILFEFRRPPFNALAFFAFSLIFDFAVFEYRLHFYFPAATAKEFLRSAGSTRVFTGLSHSISPFLVRKYNKSYPIVNNSGRLIRKYASFH